MGFEMTPRPLPVRVIARLTECLLPRDPADAVIGDLLEEFSVRAQTMRQVRATAWFAGQAVRSVPRLLLLSVNRWSWLKSLGVAVLAFEVLERLEPIVRRWLVTSLEPDINERIVISLLVGFASCACGGCLATWMRRGSALIYSAIGTSFLVYASVTMDVDEPLWIPTAFIVTALLAPIIGGVGFIFLADHWQRRRRKQ
jgi:hypothetical protein